MRTYVLVLSAALLLAPVAAADEDTADCEEGQPWFFAERSGVQPTFDALDAATPGDLALCEGEQWDGQDNVDDQRAACTGTWDLDPPFVGLCLDRDPNSAPSDDLNRPLGARASTDGSNEVYTAIHVAFVSRAAIYVGTCGEGEAGLEGQASCAGSRELRTGLYWRDNTFGNMITQLTPRCLLSVIGCYPTEADCDYETYRVEQEVGGGYCDRDNTAFGASLILP